MRKFLLIASLGALMASCAQEEIPQTPTTDGTPLTVSTASIATLVTKAAITGTTTPQPQTLSSGSINVCRAEKNGYTFQNSVFTYGTSWTTGEQINLNNNSATVCAYYQLDASIVMNSMAKIQAVNLTSQLYDPKKDLCYDYQSKNNQSSSVDFILKHAYSAITFSITKDGSYNGGTGNISKIDISNPTIYASATLDITGGTYTRGTTPEGIVSFNPGIATIADGAVASTSVLMVPVSTAFTGSTTLTFTIDGKAMSTTLTKDQLKELVAGNNYKISLLLKGTALTVTSVSITDWKDVTVNSTDININ